MSDDDYYYDDDEYSDFDDFPLNEAEDLAVHAVYSPVLVNYDPAWETASLASDWEYYSDEYWEEQGPSKKWKPKENRAEGAEATIVTHNVQNKGRESKSRGIPDLCLGEPSLAGSIVVWKLKETTESCNGPLIDDGQGEKVSLLKDWRERFKLPTTVGPKSHQRKDKHEALATDAGDSPLDKYHDNVLLAPPTMLEELKGLPSTTRVTASPLREPAFKSNVTAFVPSFNEDSDNDKDISDSNDVVKSYGYQRMLAVELPDHAAVVPPRPRMKPDRPEKQQRTNIVQQKGNESELKSQSGATTSNGKRKALSESSSSDDATRLPNRNAKRRRSKEQRPSSASEQSQLGPSVETTPSLETKRRGRPKKHKTLPLSKGTIESDLGTRAPSKGKNEMTDPANDGLMQPRSVNRLTSIQGKRKASNAEVELSMPALKKRTNVEKTIAVASTTEPIARRSMRKK